MLPTRPLRAVHTAVCNWFRASFDFMRVARVVLLMAPTLACFLSTGDSSSLKAGFLGVLLLSAAEKTQPSLFLLLLHAGAILGSVALFSLAYPYAWLFVPLCAAYGAAAGWLGRWGPAWQSLGNYGFLAALYLGCELNAGGGIMLAGYLHLLSWSGLALVPTALVLVWKLSASEAGAAAALRVFCRRHNMLPARASDTERARTASDAAVVRCAAVLLAAALVRYLHLPAGEWLIWSAASVVTGSMPSVRRKAGDRAVGVLWGAGAGMTLCWVALQAAPAMLHTGHALPAVCTLVTAISLGCCQRYRLAFGLRSMMCVVLAATSGYGVGVAVLRSANVLVGGMIGAALTLLYEQRGARIPRL
ncbi:FUSC family protein [Pseudoduganella sp. R-31]|uniref:FUSC family protein n=1 Tax=Pseudoduganella sp. R-31 TaxID=3404060 RepID=UPI003CFA976D